MSLCSVHKEEEENKKKTEEKQKKRKVKTRAMRWIRRRTNVGREE